MAPVPVSKLVCDGNTYKCTASLVRSFILCVWFIQFILKLSVMQVWGAGNWVAQWDTAVFHTILFWVQNVDHNKSSRVFANRCDALQPEICPMYNKLFWIWDSFARNFVEDKEAEAWASSAGQCRLAPRNRGNPETKPFCMSDFPEICKQG